MKVLLLDDNISDAELVIVSLRQLKDVQIIHIKSFKDFKAGFTPGVYSAIISDYNLFDGYGDEVLDYVKKLDTEIPFIIISGSLGDEKAVSLLKQGATDYVLKDNLDKLPLALTRALKESEIKAAQKLGNQKLFESEEKLRSINYNSPDIMNSINRDGVITYSNRYLNGHEEETVIGHDVMEFVPEEFRKTYKEYFRNAFKGIPQEFEMKGYSDHFKSAWYRVRMAPEHINGKINSILVISTDITLRKAAIIREEVVNNISNELNKDISTTQFLQRIRLELGRIFPTDSFYVSTFDKEKDELTFIFQYIDNEPDPEIPHSRVNGNGLSEFVIKTKNGLLLEGDKIVTFQQSRGIFIHMDKTQAWLGVPIMFEKEVMGVIAALSFSNTQAFTLKDKDLLTFVGSLVGAFIARKRSAGQLKDSQVKWDSLVRNSGDIILTTSKEGNINYINKVVHGFEEKRRILGDFVGQEFETLVNEKDVKLVSKRIKACIKHKETASFIMQGKFSGHYYDCTSTPLMQENKFQGLIIILKDITELMQAQNSIRESEEKYRSVVQDQTEYIVRWKPNGEIIFANQSYLNFAGLTLEELYNRNYHSMVPDKEKKRFNTKIGSLTVKNPVKTDSHHSTHPERGNFWHEWIDRAFFDKNGKVMEYQSVGRDITIQKNAELEIRKSENKYKSLFQRMHEGLLVSNEEGIIKLVNFQFAGMLGYEEDELIGKNGYHLLLDPQERDRLRSKLNDRKIGISESYESKLITKTGELLLVSLSSSPMYDEDGKFEGVMSIVTDISERIASEIKLKLSYNEIRNLERISNAVIQGRSLTEISGIILEGLANITGILSSRLYLLDAETGSLHTLCETMDDALLSNLDKKPGLKLNSINHDIEKDSMFMELIEKKKSIISTNEKEIGELMIAYPGRTASKDLNHWIRNQMNIRTFGVLPIIADDVVLGLITFTSVEELLEMEKKIIVRFSQHAGAAIAKKKTEEELGKYKINLEKIVEERTKKLNELNEELEAFNYSVSHDLRTPVRAIDIYRGLLAHELKESPLLQYVNQIEKCVHEMNELIKSLLEFSKMSKAPITIEAVDLNALVVQCFEKQKKHENAPNTKLKIDKLPVILADNKLLTIVINNLISNAVKYSNKQKKPLVEVGYTEAEKNFVIYIKDNGVGFNNKLAGKLFKPFSRLHHGDEFKGTGAGLAIVERILRRHHGKIYAESEMNKGAVFYFTLPKKFDHIPYEKEINYH
jgi:PAS domain S-box-containing protein